MDDISRKMAEIGMAKLAKEPFEVSVPIGGGATAKMRSATQPTRETIRDFRKQLGGRIPGAVKGPAKFLAAAAVAGGTIAGIHGLERAIGKMIDAGNYKKDYEGMLEFSPDLKKFDKEQVKARFDTLRKFNPEMSSDPLVASSWIKQTIEYPVVTPATLKDVIPKSRPDGAFARAVPSAMGVFD